MHDCPYAVSRAQLGRVGGSLYLVFQGHNTKSQVAPLSTAHHSRFSPNSRPFPSTYRRPASTSGRASSHAAAATLATPRFAQAAVTSDSTTGVRRVTSTAVELMMGVGPIAGCHGQYVRGRHAQVEALYLCRSLQSSVHWSPASSCRAKTPRRSLLSQPRAHLASSQGFMQMRRRRGEQENFSFSCASTRPDPRGPTSPRCRGSLPLRGRSVLLVGTRSYQIRFIRSSDNSLISTPRVASPDDRHRVEMAASWPNHDRLTLSSSLRLRRGADRWPLWPLPPTLTYYSMHPSSSFAAKSCRLENSHATTELEMPSSAQAPPLVVSFILSDPKDNRPEIAPSPIPLVFVSKLNTLQIPPT